MPVGGSTDGSGEERSAGEDCAGLATTAGINPDVASVETVSVAAGCVETAVHASLPSSFFGSVSDCFSFAELEAAFAAPAVVRDEEAPFKASASESFAPAAVASFPVLVARLKPKSLPEARVVAASEGVTAASSALELRESSSDCMPSRKLPVPLALPEALPAAEIGVSKAADAAPARPVPGAAVASAPWPAVELPITPISIPAARVMRWCKAEGVPKCDGRG